jgi:hypothetical protein
MRPNPLDDAAHFLTQAGWFTPVFWLLLLASFAIAILVWQRQPEQRAARNLGIWGLRVLMGSMWWQQTLWKIPPNFGGLQYWMQQEADHAAIALQGALVRDVVLPNLVVFVLACRRVARPAYGPEPLARALFSPRRMAVDLHVSGDDSGVVRDRAARASPGH